MSTNKFELELVSAGKSMPYSPVIQNNITDLKKFLSVRMSACFLFGFQTVFDNFVL